MRALRIFETVAAVVITALLGLWLSLAIQMFGRGDSGSVSVTLNPNGSVTKCEESNVDEPNPRTGRIDPTVSGRMGECVTETDLVTPPMAPGEAPITNPGAPTVAQLQAQYAQACGVLEVVGTEVWVACVNEQLTAGPP